MKPIYLKNELKNDHPLPFFSDDDGFLFRRDGQGYRVSHVYTQPGDVKWTTLAMCADKRDSQSTIAGVLSAVSVNAVSILHYVSLLPECV